MNEPIREDSRSKWNAYSMLLLALMAAVQVLQWPDLPRFVDIYYHLSVASGFEKAGGFVTWDYWECAPAGRPHLYPPLLHFLLMALSRAGLPWIAAGQLAESLLTVGLFASLWYAVRTFSGPRAAFFAAMASWSCFPLYLAAGTLLPFTLALLLGLPALAALGRGRFVAAGILLGLGFYAHLLMGGVCLAAAIMFSLLCRERRTGGLLACAGAMIIASPFLWYAWAGRAAFGFVRVREFRAFQVDPLVHGFALAGLVIAVRSLRGILWTARGPSCTGETCAGRPAQDPDCGLIAPLCLAAAMLLLVPTHRVRFISGHGLVAMAWMAALALDRLWPRIMRARPGVARHVAVACIVVAFAVAGPMVHVNTAEGTVRPGFRDRTLLRCPPPADPSAEYPKEGGIFRAKKEFAQIAAAVRANTAEDDIIWSDYNYGAGVVSLLAGRAMSSFMMLEVPPPKQSYPLDAARVHIWFKSAKDGDVPARMNTITGALGMKLLVENDLAWVWLNPMPAAKTAVPRPAVPAMPAMAAACVLLAVAAADLARRRRPAHVLRKPASGH